jgi:hypothetical protein
MKIGPWKILKVERMDLPAGFDVRIFHKMPGHGAREQQKVKIAMVPYCTPT